MARIAQLKPEEMTPAQRSLHETSGGSLSGPSGIWLRVPELAARTGALTNYLRKGIVEARLFELMTLIVARQWSAQYVFYAHQKLALDAGVTAEVIDAVRTGRVPAFARADEKLVYEMIVELMETRDLTQATFDRALATFGLECTVELVTGIGTYTAIAMLGKSFGIAPPGGERPLP
jgi:4-carboxymuconolactone decarboxylase